MIKNNKGFITADYLFALVMVLGFTVVMFSMAIALVGAEVTQYMTFSAARAYLPAHKNYDTQRALGKQKFDSLAVSKAFRTLFNGNWFEKTNVSVGSHKSGDTLYTFEDGGDADKYSFYGASSSFTAKILNFNVPLLGSTTSEGPENNDRFNMTIGSYLGREPSQTDCNAHMSGRWQAIRNLNGGNYSTNTSGDGYYGMADNGC